MRVGVVGPLYPDSFAENIAVTLEAMGVPVVRLGAARPHPGSPIASLATETLLGAVVPLDGRVQQRLAQRALDAGCTLVISVDARLLPAAVARLRAGGSRVAFWFPDAVVNLGRQLMLAAQYDALYFKDPTLVARLVDLLDLPIRYLPQACNPRVHLPVPGVAVQPHIAVVGNFYPSRVLLLDRLLRDGVPLALFGTGLPRWLRGHALAGIPIRPYVAGLDKARVFRQAAAVLNNLHPGEMAGTNARLFEAAASGGTVLCEERDGLADLFDVGTEVLAFRDYAELTERIGKVLADPAGSRAFGDAAARRAHDEHTFEHRLRVILEDLG